MSSDPNFLFSVAPVMLLCKVLLQGDTGVPDTVHVSFLEAQSTLILVFLFPWNASTCFSCLFTSLLEVAEHIHPPGCLTVCPLGKQLQMQEYLLLQKPHLKFFLLVLSQSINFLCEGWDV